MLKVVMAAGGTPLALGIAAAAASLAWVGQGTEPVWLLALAIGLVVARIAWQDILDFTIPDGALVVLAAIGAALRLADGAALGEPPGATLLVMGVDVLLSGGLLLALREAYYRRRGYDGLGFGDVKLGAAGGILAGASGFAWALLAASLAGIAVVMACRRWPSARLLPQGSDRLPFGAILAPALGAVWLMGQVPGLSALVR